MVVRAGCAIHHTADDEFRDLSFEFGVELDDITTEREMFAREAGGAGSELASKSDEIVYKIDVPANRCARARSSSFHCQIYCSTSCVLIFRTRR